MKTKRQLKMLELIKKHDIETQEELSDYLLREGFQVTQATVSRTCPFPNAQLSQTWAPSLAQRPLSSLPMKQHTLS